MQELIVRAEMTSERADALIRHLADDGWSVTAEQDGKRWKIAAMRQPDAGYPSSGGHQPNGNGHPKHPPRSE